MLGFPGLSRKDADSVVHFIWQAEMHKVAKVVIHSLDILHSTNAQGLRHLIRHNQLEEMQRLIPYHQAAKRCALHSPKYTQHRCDYLLRGMLTQHWAWLLE